MEKPSLEKLAKAIAQYRRDGRIAYETAAIVEALHSEAGLSYSRLAEIADVSTQGIKRWRERNMGEANRFDSLLKYAQQLLDGPISPTLTEAVPTMTHVSPNAVGTNSPSFDEGVPNSQLAVNQAKASLAAKLGVKEGQIEIIVRY